MSFQDNKMLIMPAVDIKNGKCVQLVQGEPGTEQVIIENPEKVARKWEDLGAEVHLKAQQTLKPFEKCLMR